VGWTVGGRHNFVLPAAGVNVRPTSLDGEMHAVLFQGDMYFLFFFDKWSKREGVIGL
jgi:hypothetical protein